MGTLFDYESSLVRGKEGRLSGTVSDWTKDRGPKRNSLIVLFTLMRPKKVYRITLPSRYKIVLTHELRRNTDLL